MASSSSPKTCKNDNQNQEEQEGNWLDLGLGLGSTVYKKQKDDQESDNMISASSAGLELGLGGTEFQRRKGIQLGNEVVRSIDVPMTSNYHHKLSLCNSHDYNHHGGVNNMPSSSSLSSCTWQFWQMDTHDYLGRRRRPHCGLWFTLRSSTNRQGEVLPQIQKTYIRVKDENMTVFMVKRYLVTKLGLSNETEIDISCMGQNLLCTQTLRQVRDAVWLPRLVESVNSSVASIQNPNGCSINYLLPLQYGKRCIN